MGKNNSGDTGRANLELNSRLDGRKGISATRGETEAERANVKMDEQFRGDGGDQPAEDVSPAFVYNPAIRINPEDKR